MWWMLEVLLNGRVDTVWCRSKEGADDYLAATGAKLLRVAHPERRCGKRVDDPPTDLGPPEGRKRTPSAREVLQMNEEWYFDPEVPVDEWE